MPDERDHGDTGDFPRLEQLAYVAACFHQTGVTLQALIVRLRETPTAERWKLLRTAYPELVEIAEVASDFVAWLGAIDTRR